METGNIFLNSGHLITFPNIFQVQSWIQSCSDRMTDADDAEGPDAHGQFRRPGHR